MPSQLFTTTATAGDDFLVLNDPISADGGDGDDYILSNWDGLFLTGTSTDFASPASIDNSVPWTREENPFVATGTIPHTTLYILTDAGQNHYSAVTVGAGQTITVDVDFGNTNPIGVDTDTYVQLYDSGGTLVATNDDGGNDVGGAGSTSNFDSFLTFTNTTGAPVTYTIAFREFSGDQLFEGGETFVANISVTGHDVGDWSDSSSNTLHGGAGDDTIAGQAGNDSLFGDTGNDTLIGGSGNDALDGGDGSDFASYGGAAAAVTVDLGNTGAQNTHGAGTDTLTSIENVFGSAFSDTFIGSAGDNIFNGSAGTDVVSYATAAGAVTVNLLIGGPQNTVSAGIDSFISIENLIGSAFNDTMSGNGGNNTLQGAAGGDILSGSGGNDTLNGGAGGDTLDGGAGNDTLNGGADFDYVTYLTSPSAVIVDLGNSLAQNTGGGGVDRLLGDEGLIGSTFNDILLGNADGNVLQGDTGNDTISGRDGGDIVQGGLGNDSLHGDAGGDIVQGGDGDDSVYGDDGDDIVQGDAGNDNLFGGAGNDIAQGFDGDDNVFGDDGADIVTGDAGNDNVLGGAGNDIVEGGDGSDVLQGGAGDDQLEGDAGNDFLDGGDGLDTAYYGGAAGAVVVSLAIVDQFQTTGGDGFDSLTSMENLTGSQFDDTLTGNSGANVLMGNNGNDTLDGAGGNDTASYASAASAVTVGLIAGAQDTGGAGIDTLISIENLIGSNSADTLTGNSGANRLEGGYGNDALNGGSGNDTMVGGFGDDTFTVKDAGDVVIEGVGEGTDTVRSTITHTLSDNVENLVLTGSSNVNGIGNDLDNAVTGNTGANVLKGLDGADTLIGGAGNDSLYGGAGNDHLFGNAGADKFYFNTDPNTSTNFDVIQKYSVADDTIYLSRDIFDAIGANGTLASGAFFTGSAAHDSSDRIIFDSTTGNIYYDADGNGAGAAIRFAKVAASTVLTNADFVAYSSAAAPLSASSGAPAPLMASSGAAAALDDTGAFAINGMHGLEHGFGMMAHDAWF
jgi:Ca2+-binding RTX toxin-like protein